MSSGPELIGLEDPSKLESLTPGWLELAARLGDTSYFQTPDWVLAWWETIGRRPPTRAAVWRAASGSLEALVLMSRAREPLHPRLGVELPVYVNAGTGAGDADHCGWLVSPPLRDAVAAWVSESLGGSAGLLLRSVDGDSGRPPLPARAHPVGTTACPRLALTGPDQPVGRSRSFGRQLARFTRRLEREGVRFEWVASKSIDKRLLRTLFGLHELARGRHGTQTNFGLEQLALHLRLVERSDASRGPVAIVARNGDEVAGILYGFQWRDTFAAYQWGWDPRFARHSMGSVLTYHGIRLAAERGARTFDFLRGAEPYKYRFGAVDRRDRTWLVPHGPSGALLAARYRAARAWGALRGRPDPMPLPPA